MSLSQLQDLTITKTIELNEQLELIYKRNESTDTWKTPDLKESRIFSAYMDTRPEVVLNESPDLTYENSAWAIVSI